MGILVAVSGGYDILHIGHIRNIREAAKLGDKLVVIISRDDQLVKKKGFCVMTLAERKEILENIKDVDEVIVSVDKDITCNESLELVRPAIFAKGGDRVKDTMPKIELDACKKIGCEIRYNVGGGKIQSSSNIAKKLTNRPL